MQERVITIKIMDVGNAEHLIEVSNKMTGYELKTYIYERISQSLTQHQMKLVYAGTQIHNNQKLSAFNLAVGNVITFEQQKIDLSQVSQIIAVNEEDQFSGQTIVAKMPCGHSMGRDSMVVFIRSLISQKKYQIRCPNQDEHGAYCLFQWDWKLCKKVGVFTKEENQIFQIGLSENWIKKFGKECPSCKNIVSKGDLKINRVKCPSCKFGDFCYMCLEPWKGKDNNFCGSPTCQFVNQTLEKAPWTRIFKLKDTQNNNVVIEVKTPKYRICPNCRIPIEQYDKCKHTKCLGCQKSFCWVCLSKFTTTWECGESKNYCGKVAQVQNIKTT